jgi:hypothetical protein
MSLPVWDSIWRNWPQMAVSIYWDGPPHAGQQSKLYQRAKLPAASGNMPVFCDRDASGFSRAVLSLKNRQFLQVDDGYHINVLI